MSQPSPNHSKSIERTLFEGALGLSDPDERRAFLEQTCQGNPALREKLEKLLNNRDRAEDFFDVPPVKMPAGVTRMAVLEGEEGAPFFGRYQVSRAAAGKGLDQASLRDGASDLALPGSFAPGADGELARVVVLSGDRAQAAYDLHDRLGAHRIEQLPPHPPSERLGPRE